MFVLSATLPAKPGADTPGMWPSEIQVRQRSMNASTTLRSFWSFNQASPNFMGRLANQREREAEKAYLRVQYSFIFVYSVRR